MWLRRRTLFAPRPDCFARSRIIVLWHGNEAKESFEMQFPLVESMGEHGDLQRRGVLGCRYRDGLSSPIGLKFERRNTLRRIRIRAYRTTTISCATGSCRLDCIQVYVNFLKETIRAQHSNEHVLYNATKMLDQIPKHQERAWHCCSPLSKVLERQSRYFHSTSSKIAGGAHYLGHCLGQ